MKPASTSMRPLPEFAPHARRVADVLQAHTRALFDAQAAGCGPGANRPRVESTVVWKSSRSSRLAFGDAALGVLIGLAAVAAFGDLADGILRLLLEFGQGFVGAALQFLRAWRSRASPTRARFPSRGGRVSTILSRRLMFERRASLRCGGAVRSGSG